MVSRYIKKGVKRQHNIIDGILPILEDLAKINGVKKVIPSRISYSPKRGIEKLLIKFQRETISGFKMLAHGKGSIQEIFVVVDKLKRDDVEKKLKEYILNYNG